MELIKVDNNIALLSAEIGEKIAQFEKQIKMLKEQEEALKAAILAEMEAKGIIKVDNEHLTITYIAETDRETFDTKAFKAEFAELYNEYTKISKVKPSIRIKVK